MKKLFYLLPSILILAPAIIEHSESEYINPSIEMREIVLNTEFAWEKEIDPIFLNQDSSLKEIRYYVEGSKELRAKYRELAKMHSHILNKPIYEVDNTDKCNVILNPLE